MLDKRPVGVSEYFHLVGDVRFKLVEGRSVNDRGVQERA